MRRSAVSYCALLAGLAVAPGLARAASATCVNVVAGEHAFVGPGETCAAPGGAYSPTSTGTTILPFNDPGYGFVTYSGGQLSTPGAVTIATTADSASAVRSAGAGSLTTLTNGAVLSTSGANANAVQADSGGAVTLGAPSSAPGTFAALRREAEPAGLLISTTGAGSAALASLGAGSQISATGATAEAAAASALIANNGGALSFDGGQAKTTGQGLITASAFGGGSLTLSNASVIAAGAGSNAIQAQGAGSTVQATNASISSLGGAGVAVSGGAARLTDSTIVVGGASAIGSITVQGGSTTIVGGAVSSGDRLGGAIYADTGGRVDLQGVQLSTGGDGAQTIHIQGATLSGTNLTIASTGGVDAATGALAAAVVNAGTLQLSGSAISATGASAIGVLTGDSGSTTIAGGSITTSGAGASALLGSGGSIVAQKDSAGQGTMIATTGDSAAAVVASGGAGVALTGASITTAGAGSAGVTVRDPGTSVTLTSVSIATSGGVDPATGDHASALYNGPGAAGTRGGSLTLTDVFATTSGAGAYGLLIDGVTTVTGGGFATSGADSTAVLALDASQAELNGAALSAKGDGSGGLVMNGAGEVSAAHLTITTSGGVSQATGSHADGVYNGAFGAYSGGGTLKLVDSTVTTSGYEAYGVFVGAGGTTTVLGGSVTTSGEGAQGLGVTGGSLTVGLDAAGNAATVSTSGASAPGAAAYGGGALSLTGTRIATTGIGSIGLAVGDAATTVTATGVTITTTGGQNSDAGVYAFGVYNGATGTSGGKLTLTDSNVSTSGILTDALRATSGGVTTILGGALTSSGEYAAAADVIDAATVSVSDASLTSSGAGSAGLVVKGSGGSVSVANSSITDSGDWLANQANSFAVFNGANGEATGNGALTITDSKISASGAHAIGLFTGSQATTAVYGGSISVSGADSASVLANGGATTLATDQAGQGVAVSTSGASSPGVVAYNGASLTMTGATIATLGDGSAGLKVYDADTSVTATNTTMTTKGGLDAATGDVAYGVFNGPGAGGTSGGSLTLDNASVSTTGDRAFALLTDAGGATTATGGAFSTSGAGADAVVAQNGGSATISGARLTTTGEGAYGAAAIDGGALQLGDGVDIVTSGAGAHGLYVSGPGSAADLTGAVAIHVSGAGAAGIYVDSGGAVAAKGPLTVNAATYGLYVNGYASDAIGPTALGLAGPLTLKTTDPSGAAITLNGNSASFAGSGGGVIDAAGTAIAFLNGGEQSAAFANYEIDAPEIVYADPATATVVFDNTTANAGNGNLAHVVGGSELTLTAFASSLTGAFQTQAGSVSNVTLSGGSTWTITGNSTVTNLSLVNSSAGFAPASGGAFHTLTVTNFIGQGGSLTLNAALGGADPGADKLVINGGQATGSTTINIRPIGNAGAGAAGQGVPLVVTTNGGTIAPGAFALSGPVTVGGYVYSLQSQSDGEYLVSSQALSPAAASGSLANLAQSRQSQATTSRVLSSILTGATEQINCSSCSSGFASFGSFALGVHGRWTLSPSLALLAGGSYDSYSAKGVTVDNSLELAVGLRYDMVQLGRYRPFFEAGVAVSPYANVSFNRGYASGSGGGVGVGDTLSRSVAAYGRAGYIWRLTPRDEAAAYASYTRSWQSTGGYLEGATAGNPFGALVRPSLDTMNIAEIGAQYTHLFGQHIEANVSAGYAVAFDANYGSQADIAGFGAASGVAPASFNWAELGGRLSYRFSRSVIADAFALGTLGAEPAGDQIHGGVALRMAF